MRFNAWWLLGRIVWLFLGCFAATRCGAAETAPNLSAAELALRQQLARAALTNDAAAQQAVLDGLIGRSEAIIEVTLTAWRGGTLYVYEEGDRRVPFLLESQTDADGNAHGLSLLDASVLKDATGAPILFASTDLTPVDADARLRKALKGVLDLLAIGNPNPKMRRDAVTKLGQELNLAFVPYFEKQQQTETEAEVKKALLEAIALTRTASPEASVRIAAIQELGDRRSINSLAFLQQMVATAKKDPTALDVPTVQAAQAAVAQIERYMAWGNLFGTAFRGLSLAAVLLVAALGLAITFGLMGVINMAHGELMMVGAYTAYVIQNLFIRWFGAGSLGFDAYFPVAVLTSFVVTGAVGMALEQGIIRFLYRRPLESLLATWGVSLLLQQLFRHVFGAANVQVSSPRWLSGSWVIHDVLLAYNRLFVIGFAIAIVVATYLLLTRTSLGLQVRAVMQHRTMASCLGVSTARVNLMTFGFGSGLAGMAGACLSQIGNVGPSLGQNYIVDCFMVVVLGGVGNLAGSVSASLGVGVTDQILQPWLGAVLGKITVLAAIILFLQWRPAGLFVTRSRSLEG